MAMQTGLRALIADSRRGLTLMESATLADWHDTPTAAATLRAQIERHPDHESYHCLFALRCTARQVYDEIAPDVRARVLVAALSHARFLNDWGVLDVTESDDGEAALAVVDLGRAALPALHPALDDDRPAPLFGSEEATLSELHQYRRKDFAYRAVARILGLPLHFAARPGDRDRAIAAVQRRLA